MNTRVGVVILAAGSSSRLGQPKQLININGTTLLEHLIQVVRQAHVSEIIVVLGSNADTHRSAIAHLPVRTVTNSSWEAGLGTSIKTGIKAVAASEREFDMAVLLVCDQPLLETVHIESLIDEQLQNGKGIVASAYANTVGIPALFTKKYFSQLMALPDKQGAKHIIQQHLDDTALVDFPEGEFDIDTPEDLKKLNIKLSSTK